MKRILLTGVVTVFLTLFSVAIPAAATQSNGAVRGKITSGGDKVKGAAVRVECVAGSKTYYRNSTSNSSGNYTVYFPANDCPAGAKITVTAKAGQASGTAKGVMAESNNKLELALDVPLVEVAVPEFTPVVGVATAAVAGGAILIFRRKYSHQI
jgi:hypothetical protein